MLEGVDLARRCGTSNQLDEVIFGEPKCYKKIPVAVFFYFYAKRFALFL